MARGGPRRASGGAVGANSPNRSGCPGSGVRAGNGASSVVTGDDLATAKG